MSNKFEDRVSTYPNRYRVTPSSGSAYYVTLERADEPTVLGTPLNAETFNAWAAEIAASIGEKAPSAHEHSASDITSGTLGVNRGGTGKATHTSNAVLTGNGTSAVKNVATASGAMFATAANGAPKFGTLPIAQGGTGATDGATGLKNLLASGATVLSSYQYGTTLPSAGTAGRLFFKVVK